MSRNLIVLLTVLTNTLFVNAQVDNKLQTYPKKEITTQRISSTITIDGQLNESEWLTIQPATDFVMFEPDNGRPIAIEKKTEVKILYDNV